MKWEKCRGHQLVVPNHDKDCEEELNPNRCRLFVNCLKDQCPIVVLFDNLKNLNMVYG